MTERAGDRLRPEDLAQNQRAVLQRYPTWESFHLGPRKSGRRLLASLGRYPRCVLVAGCQRSGTTILTRVIASARGFQRFALTRDDELDAALILLGAVDVPPGRRYCFQTTYLNENYNEYGMLGPGQKLIWVLRNPYSVVYSMVYHWRRAALRRLYEGCAIQEQTSARLRRSRWPWPLGPSELEKACLAYSAKTSQVEVIRQIVPAGHLMVIEYDSMIQAPEDSLGKVFGFIEEPFDAAYAAALHSGSVRKADRLPHRARRLIQMHCEPVYKRCLTLLTQPASAS